MRLPDPSQGPAPPLSSPISTPSVELERVSKRYQQGPREIVALEDVSLSVGRGEFLTIMGRSGSGKSTLLNIVAGIDTATAGRVMVAGRELTGMSDPELTE